MPLSHWAVFQFARPAWARMAISVRENADWFAADAVLRIERPTRSALFFRAGDLEKRLAQFRSALATVFRQVRQQVSHPVHIQAVDQ